MGAANSIECIDIPLLTPSKPIQATARGIVSSKFTSLSIQRESTFSGYVYNVVDITQQRVYVLKRAEFQSGTTLQTSNGRSLVSMKPTGFSITQNVCVGDEQTHASFKIHVDGLSHPIIYADFVSSQPCRIILDGSYNRVVLFYVDHYTSTQPEKPQMKDVINHPSRFRPVGRIRWPHTKAFSKDHYYVEAAPGIDLTLLLLMWQFWKNRQNSA